MNTIAITIDDDTAHLLEDLMRKSQPRRSRSSLVRAAIREFAERELRRSQEERERAVLRKHRTRLERQARALVAGQVRP